MSEGEWRADGEERAAGNVVLVVDDDEQIREVVREMLEEEGYEVWQAQHGEEALALLDEREAAGTGGPAVILLDLHMPVMDGWRFAHEYRRRPEPRAAVVAFTASRIAAPVVGPALTIAGAAATIRKPFLLEEVLEVVARHTGRESA